MFDDLITLAAFYFIYRFSMTIANNKNRKNTLKMMIDNNLINAGENNISFNYFSKEEKKSNGRYMLPVALGAMGFALGLVCSALIITIMVMEGVQSNASRAWFTISEAIQLGAPLFFASIGVVVAYVIEKKGSDKK
ncbi:MAG: hypothetical protein SNG49_08075 [Rikenellaceae bacterium]